MPLHRQIAVVVQLNATIDFEELQAFAHGRMPNLGEGLARFDLAVDETDAMLEKGRQIATSEITILIYGGGQHGAAVTAIPGRVIGAASEKGDTEWRARDDHVPATSPWLARRAVPSSERPESSQAVWEGPRRAFDSVPRVTSVPGRLADVGGTVIQTELECQE